MPDADVHVPAAVIAPLLVMRLFSTINGIFPPFSVDRILGLAILVLGSLLGDFSLDGVLEPPTAPDHRGPFHWFGFVPLVIVYYFIGDPIFLYSLFSFSFHESFVGLSILSILIGYAEHFFVDYPSKACIIIALATIFRIFM